MPKHQYVLFGTAGCHLCEDASQLLNDAGIAFSHCDIIDDPGWLQTYAVRIPVLWHGPSRRELNWPFDAEMLSGFLDSNAQEQL